MGALAVLVREGKVRYIGLSEAGAATIERAHRIHAITGAQGGELFDVVDLGSLEVFVSVPE